MESSKKSKRKSSSSTSSRSSKKSKKEASSSTNPKPSKKAKTFSLITSTTTTTTTENNTIITNTENSQIANTNDNIPAILTNSTIPSQKQQPFSQKSSHVPQLSNNNNDHVHYYHNYYDYYHSNTSSHTIPERYFIQKSFSYLNQHLTRIQQQLQQQQQQQNHHQLTNDNMVINSEQFCWNTELENHINSIIMHITQQMFIQESIHNNKYNNNSNNTDNQNNGTYYRTLIVYASTISQVFSHGVDNTSVEQELNMMRKQLFQTTVQQYVIQNMIQQPYLSLFLCCPQNNLSSIAQWIDKVQFYTFRLVAMMDRAPLLFNHEMVGKILVEKWRELMNHAMKKANSSVPIWRGLYYYLTLLRCVMTHLKNMNGHSSETMALWREQYRLLEDASQQENDHLKMNACYLNVREYMRQLFAHPMTTL